jgi:beta-phosphoglucomutase-like phosphatase (HAD superfamily)
MKFDAILFDFDGVLLESEHAGNRQIAELSDPHRPSDTPEDSMANFMGLSGEDFLAAVENWIGRRFPTISTKRARRRGAGDGGRAGLRSPARSASCAACRRRCRARSSRRARPLDQHASRHLGIRDAFGTISIQRPRACDARQARARSLSHAAQALGVDIARCVILEDSPVGATGAVASGGPVRGALRDHSACVRSG